VNQAAVLKRKAEEAAAANNRLKELLQKQKVVTEKKAKRQEQADTSNIGARIRVCLVCLFLSLYFCFTTYLYVCYFLPYSVLTCGTHCCPVHSYRAVWGGGISVVLHRGSGPVVSYCSQCMAV